MLRWGCHARGVRLSSRSVRWIPLGGLPILLIGCQQSRLPPCVVGKAAVPPAPQSRLASSAAAAQIDLAVDGSGSMLGLTGSPQATAAWKAMLRALSLAAATTGVPLRAFRSGSGRLEPLANISQAGDSCLFAGCGSFASVSSSLDSLWKGTEISGAGVPFKVAITDLEVNDGEISGLVSAIKPHVKRGAAIGVLATRLPFEGSVYNSQGVVIHSGSSLRPIYLLATGPRSQVRAFLSDVRTKASLDGIPADGMRLTLLDEHVNRPTLKAVSVQGVPPQGISSGLPVRLGSTTYGPGAQSDYQFVRLLGSSTGVRLSSTASPAASQSRSTDLALAQLEPVALPGASADLASSITVKGMQLQGQNLILELSIPRDAPAGAVRATIPRGQLPEDWWYSWNRRDPTGPEAKNQTYGLLLLLTSLSSMLVEPSATPAAAFCLAFSH
jgi:hypothetical protein